MKKSWIFLWFSRCFGHTSLLDRQPEVRSCDIPSEFSEEFGRAPDWSPLTGRCLRSWPRMRLDNRAQFRVNMLSIRLVICSYLLNIILKDCSIPPPIHNGWIFDREQSFKEAAAEMEARDKELQQEEEEASGKAQAKSMHRSLSIASIRWATVTIVSRKCHHYTLLQTFCRNLASNTFGFLHKNWGTYPQTGQTGWKARPINPVHCGIITFTYMLLSDHRWLIPARLQVQT